MWDTLLPSIREAALPALQGAATTTVLWTLGLSLFGLGAGHRLSEAELDRLRHWIGRLAAIAGTLTLVRAFTGVALFDWVQREAGTLFVAFVWETAEVAAGLALLATLTRPWRAAPALAGAGVVLTLQGAAGTSVLTLVHGAMVALWLGALLPLTWAMDRGDRAAAGLLEDWSRIATGVMGLAIVSGAGLAWTGLWPLARPVTDTAWLAVVGVKAVALVVVIGLAVRRRFLLQPDLLAGVPAAPEAVALSLRAELVGLLAAVACGAALTRL